jgi:hypothetical protein
MKSIVEIPGIGPQTAKSLAEHGFADVPAIARATVADLSAVPGFSVTRAKKTIAAAKALKIPEEKAPPRDAVEGLRAQGGAEPAETKTDKGGEKPGKKKKRKKDKGDKKGKKEKKGKKGKKKSEK